MDKKIIYKKSQIGYAVLFLVAVVVIGSVQSFNKWDSSYLVSCIVLPIYVFIFHKLTIVIDEEEIYAYFGIGFFKRKMYLKDISFDTIETGKEYWFSNLGIRFTRRGLLYNINFGKTIRIRSKNDGRVFFAGTNESEIIKAALLKIRDTQGFDAV